jgi:preprotein translocase subunit SecD
MAILMGAAFLLVFMSIYYKKAGVVAIVTLVLNLFFMLALLSAFGATLTLPGLAGLALTIGMAVDSNVLVFERIKEELRNGSTRDAAVEAGYDKAMSAIIDANITTLLTGVLLYYFGTGPIRGFAVTLSVGILTTIYCAAYVGRLMFEVLPLRSKGKEISI